jgi:predicted transcriptional regulator
MTVTSPSPEQVNLVIEKLDEIERELTRIRVMLLPVETPTKEEMAEIEKGRREISEGRRVPLQELLDELG